MADITTISAIFSSVKTATEIAKLIKNSNTLLEEAEIKLKMTDLISALADIKIELSDIQLIQKEKEDKISELKKLLSQKNKLTFKKTCIGWKMIKCHFTKSVLKTIPNIII